MENPAEPKTPLQQSHQPLSLPLPLPLPLPLSKLDDKTSPIQIKHDNNIDDLNNNSVDHTQDCCKCKTLGTPDRLKLPKPFKYPERYTSPTDHIISPISKGILARSRRGSALLPPTKIHSKIHELRSHKPVAKSELQVTDSKIQGLV